MTNSLLLPPLDEQIVSIDVETTGVDPSRDRIIEVGAVKFRGDEQIATFSSLVNPRGRLSAFITDLTGITQSDVDAAPAFEEIADDLRAFLGSTAILAHNASFDSAFLRNHGAPPRGRVYDSLDFAHVALPAGPAYGLADLAVHFGAVHDDPHRALSDAQATRHVFLALVRQLHELDAAVLREMAHLGASAGLELGVLAGRIADAMPADRRRAATGPAGIDLADLSKRLRPAHAGRRPREPRVEAGAAQPEQVRALFERGSALESTLADFEYREEQAEMAAAVASAIQDGGHLVVEAGTGVGKSLAYLVPAALHALSGEGPAVISTNTINLQDQLFTKDLPALGALLERLGVPRGSLRVARLKGRANYLCFKRWSQARAHPPSQPREARLLAKCLVWLQGTASGDRGEIELQRDGPMFTRMSASGAAGCPAPDGPCFLRKARNDAMGADLVVVNHSLVLSDLVMGGGLLPPHDVLVIDEAHHLEATATRHLGFEVSQQQLLEEIGRLRGDTGVILSLANAARAARASAVALDALSAPAGAALAAAERAGSLARDMFRAVAELAGLTLQRESAGNELRLTEPVMDHPAWSQVALSWENADLAMAEAVTSLRDLSSKSEREGRSDDLEATLLNAAAAQETLQTHRADLRQAFAEPDPGTVCWITLRRSDRQVTVHGAPLSVGPSLREALFEQERSVVLTGGTITDAGGFDRIRAAIGLDEAKELALGSPFDYRSAALVAVPDDVPEPAQPGYARAVAAAVTSIALALRQRVLVLFTSYSAMDGVRSSIRGELERQGVRVVAQGIDGPPHRVMRALSRHPETVALGVSSLWEGVDLADGSIKALIVARLPFGVPTEPVFAARSELYEDSFSEYAVPEAVRRLRQGFGRLIRSRSDRGSFVILDRRVRSKSYGRLFLESLPDCTFRTTTLGELGHLVARWESGDPDP